MPFKKGQTANPKGRGQGTPNDITSKLKNWFTNFSYNNTPKIQKAYDDVLKEDPAEALRIYILFSERVIGKATTSIDLTSGGKALQAPNIYAIGEPPEQ